MSILKELRDKVKAIFDAPLGTDTAQDPGIQAPAAIDGTLVPYTLQDGTQITVQQDGDVPSPGDTVTIAGAPAPEGVLMLQDGSAITCDATGTVTMYTAAGADPVTTDVGADSKQTPPAAHAPAAPAKPAMPAMPAAPGKSGYSEADKAMLLAAFDTVGAEDGSTLMAVLVTCVKALMQSEFGWQIREQEMIANTNAAITAYKTGLAAASQKQVDFEKVINAQKETIAKHQETIKGMFEIIDELAKMPTADPKTLTTPKKDEFSNKRLKAEEKFNKIAEDLRRVKADA